MKKIFFKKFKFKYDKGFTLIELLVVISIIGLLASVVIASTNTSRAKARDAKRIEDMKNIQIALEMFYDDNKHYPEAKIANIGITVDYSVHPHLGLFGNYGWSEDEINLWAITSSTWTYDTLEKSLEPYIHPLPKEKVFGHYIYNPINGEEYYGLGYSIESSSNFDLVNNDGGYFNGDNFYYEIGQAPSICKKTGKDWFGSDQVDCP